MLATQLGDEIPKDPEVWPWLEGEPPSSNERSVGKVLVISSLSRRNVITHSGIRVYFTITIKAHTDRTRFGNATRILDFQCRLASGPYTEGGGGGGQQGQLPPQRKSNLQFLFYFKYIGQDKSCLIFKYIGVLSSFAPLAKKSCVRPCLALIFSTFPKLSEMY